MNRILFRTALFLGVLLAAPSAPAAPVLLADSTTADRWTLPNGLEVVTRDLPGAQAISVTWGYRIGLDNDPPDQPGLASLLAEVGFTAPAGDTPERTRDEMESLRPRGWSLRVNRRHTLFTETATPEQFAGVLRQLAVRMRGVTVTDSGLRGSLATVRRTLGERYFGAADQMLYWRVREYARGRGPNDILALAAAKGLDRETPGSVQQTIARAYVPANGVLALAGDLSRLDLHAIVAAEFGALPPGTRLPDPPVIRLDSATVVLERPEVTDPAGVVGLIAPALTDSMHPSFFLSMLMMGTHAKFTWGLPTPPLTTRFQFSLLDDPEFVRFYPRLTRQEVAHPQSLSTVFGVAVSDLLRVMIARKTYDTYRDNVLWMVGGPLSEAFAEEVRRDPAALNVLSTSIAMQALWGSEAFWTEYRRRFDFGVSPGVEFWTDWMSDPRHQVRLLLLPKR